MNEIEDVYAYYVMILNVSEDMFWNADIPFLERAVEDKTAYDKWMNYERHKARERARK